MIKQEFKLKKIERSIYGFISLKRKQVRGCQQRRCETMQSSWRKCLYQRKGRSISCLEKREKRYTSW